MVKSFAFRAISCSIIGIGILSNFPLVPPQQQDASSSTLRGTGEGMALHATASSTSFFIPSNETTNYAGFIPTNDTEDGDEDVKLDFFVSGFPKCGTTTLLRTFEQHEETVMPHDEECSLDIIFRDDQSYQRLANHLMSAANSTSSNHDTKRGIKCPFGLTTPRAIERLEEWFPSTKLIFGIRNPVFYFQSFYNYRVLMVHQGKLKGPIPSPESLIGSNDWIRVSTESARFEKVALEKLGKTASSKEPQTSFKVFLYTLEQMEDKDANRTASLRETLETFLQLKSPIAPLPRANFNKFVGKEGFDETINICDTKHDKLRSVLVENGKVTQQWILTEFLASPDVTVANEGHFREIVSHWGTDPCAKKEDKQAEK